MIIFNQSLLHHVEDTVAETGGAFIALQWKLRINLFLRFSKRLRSWHWNMWVVCGEKVMTLTWWSDNICNASGCTWMEQLSMNNTASLFGNSSFDRSLLIQKRRTVEMYWLTCCQYMCGLLHWSIITAIPILNVSVSSLLSIASLACEQMNNVLYSTEYC